MKPNKHQNKKWIVLIILVILVCVLVTFLPFIIEKLYYAKAPFKLFEVSYEAKDILAYYGSVLSFAGATILGILTLRQNKKAQEKSDEVNRLQIEFQKKSMAMAEAQYAQSKAATSTVPKFEISLHSYNGNYANLELCLKNVSSIFASNISFISFLIQDEDANEIANVKQFAVKHHSLSSAQETIIKTDTPNMVVGNGKAARFYQNIRFVLSFSCEDEMGNTHYYRAAIEIPSTREFCHDSWQAECVG
ncbi:MAG: hypothetical protein UD575_00380 [Oscillospiraceae bacterium]|nr:hypothetical protein [Oscillospiraceae bacterium]